MTVRDAAEKLGLTVVCGGPALNNEITGCYCGDLLSWVMGRAKKGDAWITVMGNTNAVAVASLCEAACCILAEGALPDENAASKAGENGVAVLRTESPAAETVHALLKLLDEPV